jgi:hypothetical protein
VGLEPGCTKERAHGVVQELAGHPAVKTEQERGHEHQVGDKLGGVNADRIAQEAHVDLGEHEEDDKGDCRAGEELRPVPQRLSEKVALAR